MRSILLFAAVGCYRRHDLPDVPIVGGTPEQRELVREELAVFDAAVGPGRLRISAVVFRSLAEPYSGRARTGTDRVLIDVEVPLWELREVVRHELCHTLDYDEGLLDDPVPAVDAFADRLDRSSRRGRRSEALAQACEIGPTRALAMADGCPGDPPLAADLYEWTARHVWSAFEEDLPLPPIGPPVTAWSFPTPIVGIQAAGTIDPDTVQITIFDPDGAEARFYFGLDGGEGDPASPTTLPQEPPPPMTGGMGWGWPDGPGAGLLVVHLPGLGWAERRLLASDGADWGIVPGACLDSTDWATFEARDALWFAWREDQTVGWAPIPSAPR